MREFLREGGQIARFSVVGGIGGLVYYGLLYGLTEFVGMWYITSSVVASLVRYLLNFTLQKFWTFRNRTKRTVNRQLTQYSILALTKWVLNTALLYVLVEYLHLWYLLAQGILSILLSVASYFGSRWIFRNS